MTTDGKLLRSIETKYAAVQSTYWIAICAKSSFMAVFLSYYGLSDTRIGLTSAMVAGFTIAFQLFVSKFSDARQQTPIKRIITALYIVAIMGAVLIVSLPLSAAAMMLVYALTGGFSNTINGLLNAQFMQYINLGFPVQYGWPRGVGSVLYALAALALGALVERFDPSLLMPVFIAGCLAGIGAMALMPNPSTLTERRASVFVQEKGSANTTYRDMLKRSPVLVVFLLAGILLYVGQSGSLLFLVRVVQGAGGGNAEFGLAMFIQGGIEMPAMFLAPKLLKRFKPISILTFSLMMYFVKGILLVLANTIALVYLAMGLSLFCFGLYGIASVYFVDSLVSSGEKVRAQGLTSLCSSVGGVVSSLLAGAIIDQWGLKTLLILSCVVLTGSLALMLTAGRMHKRDALVQPPAQIA